MLYDRRSCRTGRALRKSLGLPGGLPPHFERHPEPDFLIRWGSTAGRDARVTLNARDAVARASNKYESLRVMQNAGVRVVPFSRNPAELQGTVLGRDSYHSGGTDIVIMPAGMVNHNKSFFTQFVPSTHEMRIHVCDGEMVRAQIKKGVNEGEVPIRNHDNGYTFLPFVRQRPNAERVSTAVHAVQALGLDFGAVDLLCGRDGLSYVLEVNSSAGCCRPTASLWMGALVGAARERGIQLRADERHLEVLSPDE